MKKINILKITLDTLMTVLFVLLYNSRVIAGLTFHEAAGLAVGGIVLIHLLLNGKWIRQVTANLFNRKVSGKTRFGYLIDVLLLVFVGYIIVSGILISEVVFPNLRIGNSGFFKITHLFVSYAALVLIGIHIGLHWDWVMNLFRKIFKVSHPSRVRAWIVRTVMIAVFASGVFSIYSTGYLQKLASAGGIFNTSRMPGFSPDGQSGNPPAIDGNASGGEGFRKGKFGGGRGLPPEGFDGGRAGGDFHGKGGGMPGNAGTNPFIVIYTYAGIVSVFAILTHYFGKLVWRRPSVKPATLVGNS